MKRLTKMTFFLILSSFLTTVSFAEESAENKSEEKKEGQSASEGSGADREWAKRKSKLNVYQARREESIKVLQDMIRAKNSGHKIYDDKKNEIDVLKRIVDTHRTLTSVVRDYNKELEELKYRFPEEGVVIQRNYLPMREQSLDEIEKDMGFVGRLDKLKNDIDKKYEPFVGEKVKVLEPVNAQAESTIKDPAKIKAEENNKKRLKLSQ